MIEVDVLIEHEAWTEIGDVEALAREAIAAACEVAPEAPAAPSEVSLLLTDDAALQELNAQWRGQDKPTNVLSFPASPSPSPEGVLHIGDIALAYETVAREAESEGKRITAHFTHLVIHGVLHLLGYDHEREEEAESMESREIEALARLAIANPYRDMAV
jgi:probable rRNA maturation factor